MRSGSMPGPLGGEATRTLHVGKRAGLRGSTAQSLGHRHSQGKRALG